MNTINRYQVNAFVLGAQFASQVSSCLRTHHDQMASITQSFFGQSVPQFLKKEDEYDFAYREGRVPIEVGGKNNGSRRQRREGFEIEIPYMNRFAQTCDVYSRYWRLSAYRMWLTSQLPNSSNVAEHQIHGKVRGFLSRVLGIDLNSLEHYTTDEKKSAYRQLHQDISRLRDWLHNSFDYSEDKFKSVALLLDHCIDIRNEINLAIS